jgi:hypothetical protein
MQFDNVRSQLSKFMKLDYVRVNLTILDYVKVNVRVNLDEIDSI